MKTYITSDLHFLHKNICGPEAFVHTRNHFKDEFEMTEYLIDVHNKVVNKDDTTYNLGDLSLNVKPKVVLEILARMNGQFIIVKGNHDGSKVLKYLANNNYKMPNGKMKFEIHDVGIKIKKNGVTYHLTHYPLYIGHLRNNLRSIHGHIHETMSAHPNHFNVCIDSPELIVGTEFGAPMLLDDVFEALETKVLTAQNFQLEMSAANSVNPRQLSLDL